ncbi:hypothetical protein BDV40DRAFT_261993 [Aspergillus tamarii]|uniref:Uncharacterized protein n=1 Tax=Aspergillus tamarii TaxID=41984 RepID=A0A5N6UZ74_ASPTM|nr:hypothetical protein BDV40DRAFT_261993 [Aspergillus tamarii]
MIGGFSNPTVSLDAITLLTPFFFLAFLSYFSHSPFLSCLKDAETDCNEFHC